MPQPQKWGGGDFHKKNLKKKKKEIFRLCSRLPEAFEKTMEVHAKFAAEGRLQSRHTHTSGEKKSFFSERTWWGVWKNRKRSSVSVCPQIPCEPHLLTERGAGFETVWLQRSNHFYPPFLSLILSTSVFSLSAAHTDQTLLSRTLFLHRYEYQSAGLKMWSCYCRSAVCTNREGGMYLTQRGDRIMMSSGNISATLSQPSNPLFLLGSRRQPTRAVIVTAQQSFLFCVLKLALASSFGGCFWLASKCPSCPRSSLPSDSVLGAVIPAGLAFQNKGCMFSVCLSKEGRITAGLGDKQTEAGEPRPNLATSSRNYPRISFLFTFSPHTRA